MTDSAPVLCAAVIVTSPSCRCQVQCFHFNRLSEQIMSLCFACITQCHLVTLKRVLFGGLVALLSWEWVVNCQGAAHVFLLWNNAMQQDDTLLPHDLCFNKGKSADREGSEVEIWKTMKPLERCMWCYSQKNKTKIKIQIQIQIK